jgi:hypothetical protein
MRIYEAIVLKRRYGNITLEELVTKLMGNNVFKCPKCIGMGTIEKTNYSRDWHSGIEYADGTYTTNCDVCNGVGYTDKPLQPKMVQAGWE